MTGTNQELAIGEALMDIGDLARGIPLLFSGAIKIMREEGEELLLFYPEPGETCSRTLTCCTGHAPAESIEMKLWKPSCNPGPGMFRAR